MKNQLLKQFFFDNGLQISNSLAQAAPESVYFVCADGGIISYKSACEEMKADPELMQDPHDPQWFPVSACLHNDHDTVLHCDHSNELIPLFKN